MNIMNPTKIDPSQHHRIILEIRSISPFDEKEANSIFSTFDSYDMVFVIIHDIINHETWADLHNTKKREDILICYIGKYIVAIKSNIYPLNVDTDDSNYFEDDEEENP